MIGVGIGVERDSPASLVPDIILALMWALAHPRSAVLEDKGRVIRYRGARQRNQGKAADGSCDWGPVHDPDLPRIRAVGTYRS